MKIKLVESNTKNELKRLKNGKMNLINVYGGEGCCYELCPLYKIFNWESNTPRGKLVVLHGLLSGKIKLMQGIAEKILVK